MSGRVALVTGASRGIGRATAIRVAQDFDVVAIVARSAEVLADVAQVIRTNGGTAFPIALDLAVPESAASAVDRIVDRFERLDAVAAIAGAVSQADVFELSVATKLNAIFGQGTMPCHLLRSTIRLTTTLRSFGTNFRCNP